MRLHAGQRAEQGTCYMQWCSPHAPDVAAAVLECRRAGLGRPHGLKRQAHARRARGSMADIPADAGKGMGMGAFEQLHGLADGAASRTRGAALPWSSGPCIFAVGNRACRHAGQTCAPAIGRPGGQLDARQGQRAGRHVLRWWAWGASWRPRHVMRRSCWLVAVQVVVRSRPCCSRCADFWRRMEKCA